MKEPAWRVNTLEVEPAATVTDSGAVSTLLTVVRATMAPPAGATLVRVTVQVLDVLGPRLVGLQARDDTRTGATRVTVVLAELLL